MRLLLYVSVDELVRLATDSYLYREIKSKKDVRPEDIKYISKRSSVACVPATMGVPVTCGPFYCVAATMGVPVTLESFVLYRVEYSNICTGPSEVLMELEVPSEYIVTIRNWGDGSIQTHSFDDKLMEIIGAGSTCHVTIPMIKLEWVVAYRTKVVRKTALHPRGQEGFIPGELWSTTVLRQEDCPLWEKDILISNTHVLCNPETGERTEDIGDYLPNRCNPKIPVNMACEFYLSDEAVDVFVKKYLGGVCNFSTNPMSYYGYRGEILV